MTSLALLDPSNAGPAMPPGGPPSLTLDPTDIIAFVLMALFAIHRSEIRSTDARAFPEVPREVFDAWKQRAVSSRNLLVNACFAKIFLNNLSFYVLRSFVPPRVVWTIGPVLFFGWIAALGFGFWASSAANRRAQALGIVIGRKVIEERRAAPEPPAEEPG